MARDDQGNYYYDAGTINEQLDDFEVYERDGRLFFNDEAAGQALHMLGDGFALPGPVAPPSVDEFDNTDQRTIYVTDGSGDAATPVSGDLVMAKLNTSGANDQVDEAVIVSPTFEQTTSN